MSGVTKRCRKSVFAEEGRISPIVNRCENPSWETAAEIHCFSNPGPVKANFSICTEKNGFVTATKSGTTNEFFVAST